MLSRIDRIRQSIPARAGTERPERAEPSAAANLPVPVEPVTPVRSFHRERRGVSEFAAHLIGQDGQRRGLRAGPTIHDVARDAYNRVEWSGRHDRRARVGRYTREEI